MVASLHRRRAGGIAAIEFALVFPIVFVIFYGLVTFSDAYYHIQATTRATEDGARMARRLVGESNATVLSEMDKNIVREVVLNSLMNSIYVDVNEPRQWFGENSNLRYEVRDGYDVLTLTLHYGQFRILPHIPIFDMATWLSTDENFNLMSSVFWRRAV